MGDEDAPESFESLQPTPEEVAQNRASRERSEAEDSLRESAGPADAASKFTAAQIAEVISPDAHKLVLEFEVGGRKGYKQTYCHPERPPDPSGITIGLGYDLGYSILTQWDEDWKALLGGDEFDKLRATVGKKSGSAQSLLPALRSITIPWTAAEHVHQISTVPRSLRRTDREGKLRQPVFETETWTVVGLHHEGFDQFEGRARLDGKPGKSYANEGVSINSIRWAVK